MTRQPSQSQPDVAIVGETHATNLFPIAMIPFLLAPIAMGYMVMTLIYLRREQQPNPT